MLTRAAAFGDIDRDRYDRMVAQIVLDDGTWVQEALVGAGHLVVGSQTGERQGPLTMGKGLPSSRIVWGDQLARKPSGLVSGARFRYGSASPLA